MNQLPIPPQNIQKPANPADFRGRAASDAGTINALTPEQRAFLANYSQNIDNLAAFGLFDAEKAAQIKQNLINELVSGTPGANANMPLEMPKIGAMNEFLAENPEFFTNRTSLKAYLENAGVELDKEEFGKIAKLVEELESSAVSRFASSSVWGDMLKEYNELAKNRLNTLSASVSGGAVDVNKVYTPEEIGRMSSREFKAKEAVINEQMRKGLV